MSWKTLLCRWGGFFQQLRAPSLSLSLTALQQYRFGKTHTMELAEVLMAISFVVGGLVTFKRFNAGELEIDLVIIGGETIGAKSFGVLFTFEGFEISSFLSKDWLRWYLRGWTCIASFVKEISTLVLDSFFTMNFKRELNRCINSFAIFSSKPSTFSSFISSITSPRLKTFCLWCKRNPVYSKLYAAIEIKIKQIKQTAKLVEILFSCLRKLSTKK